MLTKKGKIAHELIAHELSAKVAWFQYNRLSLRRFIGASHLCMILSILELGLPRQITACSGLYQPDDDMPVLFNIGSYRVPMITSIPYPTSIISYQIHRA
jgi:hypothetical protein